MERITFDQLPEMVALILEKLERLESLIGKSEHGDVRLGKEMLTSTEAAAFLGVSKSWLYKMSLNQELPVYRPTGKLIYFKRSDLVVYLQRNRSMSRDEIEQEAVNYISRTHTKRKAQRFK